MIIEELNMYVDTPRDHVDSVYDQLLFGDQPLGWDIIGTKDTIRAAPSATPSSPTSTRGTRRAGSWSAPVAPSTTASWRRWSGTSGTSPTADR